MTNVQAAYAEFNREERHLAAILFHLLCDRDKAQKLLCSFETGWQLEKNWAVYFEFSYLRDHWHRLNEPTAKTESVNEKKFEFLCSIVKRLPEPDLQAGFVTNVLKDVNCLKLFSQYASSYTKSDHVISPARWQVRKINESTTLTATDKEAASLLARMFRNKPDIVMQPRPDRALCLELKINSKIDRYRVGVSSKQSTGSFMSQMQLQKSMMLCIPSLIECKFGLIDKKGTTKIKEKQYIIRSWHKIFEEIGYDGQPEFIKSAIASLRRGQ